LSFRDEAIALLLLFLVIGLLNVAIGFALAMYLGFAPPGFDGVMQSLGPMPPATPDVSAAGKTSGETSPEDAVLGDVRALAADAQSAMAPGAMQAH
jgi:hypothetical protein